MPDQNVGPIQLAGDRFETWLIRFDEAGDCASPQTRATLLDRLGAVGGAPIILFSHGWNNAYSDATKLYASFLTHLAAHLDAHPIPGPAPLCVGVLWPSTWFSWDTGPALASGGGRPADAARDELVAGLDDAAARQRLDTLLDKPAVAGDDAQALAELVAASLGRSAAASDREGKEASAPNAASVMAALRAMQTQAMDDGDELGPGGTVDDPVAILPQTAGGLGWLDPRNAVRLASVYQMKDRAGVVGGNGVARLLEDILEHAVGRVVCAGHSFGAKVVLSAVTGAHAKRKPHGVLLLQPAISHLCFAEIIPERGGRGGYADVPAKVERAILTTFSGFDQPLHDIFHLILRRHDDLGELHIAGGPTAAGNPPSLFAALGGYGPRGAGEELRQPLPTPGAIVSVPAGPALIGFDGTLGRQIGGHGDVCTPGTAWLLHSLLAD